MFVLVSVATKEKYPLMIYDISRVYYIAQYFICNFVALLFLQIG